MCLLFFFMIPSTATAASVATAEDIEERFKDEIVCKGIYARHFCLFCLEGAVVEEDMKSVCKGREREEKRRRVCWLRG